MASLGNVVPLTFSDFIGTWPRMGFANQIEESGFWVRNHLSPRWHLGFDRRFLANWRDCCFGGSPKDGCFWVRLPIGWGEMGPGLHRGIGMDIPRVRRAGRLKTREILLVSAG
jgi:hypothetical protein